MKFDVVVGNPPYGKNANLAVKFLNFSAGFSDNIYMVLPKTFRKPSVLNRIDFNFALCIDRDVAHDCFPGSISACYQHWCRSSISRGKISQVYSHPDFLFVDKSSADVAVGRVGAGPCGKVFTQFENRSANSHYFLKVNDDKVVSRLQKLSSKFTQAGTQTVGCPSLSKNDLIVIYQQSLCNSSIL